MATLTLNLGINLWCVVISASGRFTAKKRTSVTHWTGRYLMWVRVWTFWKYRKISRHSL